MEILNNIIEGLKRNRDCVFWFLMSALFQNSFPKFKIQTLVKFSGSITAFIWNQFILFLLWFAMDILDVLIVFGSAIQDKLNSLRIRMAVRYLRFKRNLNIVASEAKEIFEGFASAFVIFLLAFLVLFRFKLHDWGFKLTPPKMMALIMLMLLVVVLSILPRLKLQTNEERK